MSVIPTTTTQTITLKPGESFSLPPDAEVLYISDSTVDSTCGLPEFENYACYKFEWSLSDDEVSSVTLEHQDSRLYSIYIAGVEHIIDIDPHAILTTDGDVGIAAAIEAKVPAGIIIVDHVFSDTIGNRKAQTWYFKTFPSLIPDMLVRITGPSFGDGLYLKPSASSDCTNT